MSLLNQQGGTLPIMENTPSQQQIMSQLNTLLHTTSSSLLCGPGTECAKEQEEERLRKEYTDAKINKQRAPALVDETEKEYYTFTKGTSGYNKWKEEDLRKKVNEDTKEQWYEFKKQVKELESTNDTLEVMLDNEENVNDLNGKYKKELQILRSRLDEKSSTIATNDRKTVYEMEHLDKLKVWYKVFLVMYIALAVGLALGMFLSPNALSLMIKFVIILLLIVFPYVINPVMRWLLGIFNSTASYLPENVYLQ